MVPLWAAVFALSHHATASTCTWTGAEDSNWSTPGNWAEGVAPANGDDLVFTSGVPANQPSNNDLQDLSLRSITFSNGTFNAALTLGGNAFMLDSSHGATRTLASMNKTAGRIVTIQNDIAVSGNQTWYADNGNGIVLFEGDLSSDAGTTLSFDNDDRDHALRLAGDNSGFLGKMNLTGSPGKRGVSILSPQAMPAGNINLGNANGRISLRGLGDGEGCVYTFGMGSGDGQVNFRDSGNNTGGLRSYGEQDLCWRIGGGGDAVWSDRFESFDTPAGETRNWIVWGAPGDRLTLNGARGIRVSGNGSPLRIDYTLADGGTSRNITLEGGGLVVLNGGAAEGNCGGTTTMNGGVLSLKNMSQIFNGNLSIGTASSFLIGDGVSWSDFLAARTPGSGAGQWKLNGGGFAACGAPLVIQGSSLTDTTFDASFSLGSSNTLPDGTFVADQPIEVAQDIVLSSNLRNITVAQTGPGMEESFEGFPVYTVSGDITGAGALCVSTFSKIFQGATLAPELVLSGACAWTGSAAVCNGNNVLNSGPGGIVVGAVSAAKSDGTQAFVRFAGPDSIPTGNGGALSYWIAHNRNGCDYFHGFLLDGSADGSLYRLPEGYKIAIGGLGGSSIRSGTLGVSGGNATLANTAVVVYNDMAATSGQSVCLLCRGGNLTLGTADAPVAFESAHCEGGSNGGISSAASTGFTDRTGITTLYKRGSGTLVLANVQYTGVNNLATPLGDGRDLHSGFAWQLGRGGATDLPRNTGANEYFDGAVRTLADSDPAATDANSLKNFSIFFRGGVVEIDCSSGDQVFNRAIGAGGTDVRWRNGESGDRGGGGFSAYSSVPGHKVVVDLNTAGSRDAIIWGEKAARTSFGSENVAWANPLIFGSRTANARVEWFDDINFNGNVAGGTREIRVVDNPDSEDDIAVITGSLNSGADTTFLFKSGDGWLDLAGANTFPGPTYVTNGLLTVSGSLSSDGAAVTVYEGGAFGGTGTVARAVNVQQGGVLAATDADTATGLVIDGDLTVDGYIGCRVPHLQLGRTYTVASVYGTILADGELLAEPYPEDTHLKGTVTVTGANPSIIRYRLVEANLPTVILLF